MYWLKNFNENLDEIEIDVQQNLLVYGLDSIMSLNFRNRLTSLTNLFLPPDMAFSYPTIESITDLIVSKKKEIIENVFENEEEESEWRNFENIIFLSNRNM